MMMNKGWNRMLALTAALLWLMLLPGSTALAASEGVLAEESFGEIARDGFHIPLPEDNGWLGGEAWGMRGLFAEASRTDEQGRTLTVQAYSQVLDQFVQSDLDANRYYDSLRFENERNVSVASTEIDGFAARLVTFSYDRQDGGFAAHAGILMYARETRLLQIRVYSESERSREHSTPKVKMQDLELLAGKIHFVAEEAPIRHSDVELTIGVEGNIPVVAAGSSLQLKAVFGNEAIVNSAAENNGVTWELLDSDLGLNAAVAAINGRGLLTASKEVEWATEVVIRVTSNEFDTSATRKILVTPAATGITASPDALSFYAGENRSEIVSVAMEPNTVPPIGLSWSVNKKDLLEITDNGNGTATLRPMLPGKGTLTVTEPGGKTASVKITVLQPVQTVELSQKGKPKPGNVVAFTVKLTPYNAGDRTVEWTTDADPSVAELTNRGRLRISKDAPIGTVIHVTCTATGAPEPVSATAEVIVAEK